MIKLSEIIRKKSGVKTKEEQAIISEALKIRETKEGLPEIKKIYEDAVLRTGLIMNDMKRGEIIEGKEVSDIAEKIVATLRLNNNMLVSLVSIFDFYGERKDYLYSHSVNVSILSTNMGIALGFEESKLVDLCGSSLLHDIGMLRIPEEITNKASALSNGEYARIKEHPMHGLEILRNIKDLTKSAADVVYQHHEKEDGSGYPEGKKGEDISDYAKVVAIIEVYECLTHPRPYRQKKCAPYEAVKKIVQEERNSFDKNLLKTFFNVVTPYPLGSFVLLNSGEVGRVVEINENLPVRPIIEIYFNAEGKLPEQPTKVDLAKASVLFIEKAVDDREL